MERCVIEYGNAIKDLVAANIFPGDMLWKNFGVTRGGKVVFYDYDEIEYLTDCHFRRVPQPRNEEEEMSGEIWWHVRPARMSSPRPWALSAGPPGRARSVHAATTPICWTPEFWQAHQARIPAGPCARCFPL